MANVLLLIRDSYSDMGTFGKMYIDGKFICYTVEQVWKGNKQNESCIPEGIYQLKLRYSPVVQKTTGGEFREGYEIVGVPGRSYVMLHPANYAEQLQACVACGNRLGVVNGKWAVLNSRDTFRELMGELEKKNDWDIEIRQKYISYP